MASKLLYSAVAVAGIAALSGAAWWYQSQPTGPKEVAPSGAANAPVGAGKPAGAPGAGPAGAAPRVASVEVAKVERTTLQDDAQAVGTLRSRQNVMMRPEVSGRISALGFADGARVRKGQLLVQLDDTLQRAELRQSQAQVSIAQANFKRNQELVAQNFVAQRVLDESSANLQVAQAQMALAEARLARMAIIAPFDGTVGLRNVNLGDYVKDGADLVNLEDTGSMYVDFRLPERYQRKLRPQQTVEIALDSFPGRVFKARIEALDPLVDTNGRSVGVRAVLPNTAGEPAPLPPARPASANNAPNAPAGSGPAATAAAAPAKPAEKPPASGKSEPQGKDSVKGGSKAGQRPGPPSTQGNGPLRPGMFARVTAIFGVNESALVIPEEAVVPQGGRQFVVLVVAPADVPGATELPPDTKWVSLRREVKLGVRRQGKVEITEGLTEGQTVVAAGQQRLQRDGTPVRIIELGKPAAPATGGAPAAAPSGAAAAPGSPAAAPAGK